MRQINRCLCLNENLCKTKIDKRIKQKKTGFLSFLSKLSIKSKTKNVNHFLAGFNNIRTYFDKFHTSQTFTSKKTFTYIPVGKYLFFHTKVSKKLKLPLMRIAYKIFLWIPNNILTLKTFCNKITNYIFLCRFFHCLSENLADSLLLHSNAEIYIQ